MFGPPSIFLTTCLALCLASWAGAVLALRHPVRTHVMRWIHRARLGGLFLGAAASGLVLRLGLYQQYLASVPAIVGLGLTGGVLTGEAIRWGSRQSTGEALVETRSAIRYSSPSLIIIMASSLALFAAVSTLGFVNSAPDGRSIDYGSHSASPFPGPFYQGPALAAILLITVMALAGIRMTTTRPRNGTSDEALMTDDRLRRDSLRVIVLAWATAIFLSGAGFGFFEFTAMRNVGRSFVVPATLAIAMSSAGIAGIFATVRATVTDG